MTTATRYGGGNELDMMLVLVLMILAKLMMG